MPLFPTTSATPVSTSPSFQRHLDRGIVAPPPSGVTTIDDGAVERPSVSRSSSSNTLKPTPYMRTAESAFVASTPGSLANGVAESVPRTGKPPLAVVDVFPLSVNDEKSARDAAKRRAYLDGHEGRPPPSYGAAHLSDTMRKPRINVNTLGVQVEGLALEDKLADPDGRGAFVKPATYNSDVGSGISSQSSSASSPDTSPNITTASRMNGRVETIDTRPKSAPRQRSRRVRVADEATVLDSSSDAGEVPMLVRRASRGNGEILSDHIVFDVPVPSTNRRGSRATTASHGSRSSSPSKSARTKSSPANSAPRDAFKAESRRPSTTPSVPDPLEDAVAAHRQARDAPPPVTQHLVFPTAAVKPKKRAPGKSASGGPGSSDVFPVRPQRSLARPAAAASPAASPVVGALTTASTTGGAFASALTASVARDSTYGLVFPTAASSKRRPTNEKSALKAEGSDLPPWEQEGLDELDWMMAAQTRRPSRRAGDDAEVATEVAVDETDEPGEYGAGEELVDAAQLARQYGEVDDMAADGATADVDAAMELALAQTSMWVLGTIAAHAVGENQRRMSAIGEESDEMEGEGGGVDERDTGRTAPALGVVHPPTPSSLRQSPPAPRLEPPIVLRQPGTRPSAPVESVISDDSDDLRSTPTQPQRTPTQNTTSQRASSPSTPRAPSVTSGRSWSTFGRFNASRLGSLFSSPLGNRQDASPARSGGVSPSASRAAPHLGISSDMVKARMIVAEQQERTRVEAAETEAKEKVLAENARKPRTEESLRFESRLEQFQREERERIKRLAETKRGTAAAAV